MHSRVLLVLRTYPRGSRVPTRIRRARFGPRAGGLVRPQSKKNQNRLATQPTSSLSSTPLKLPHRPLDPLIAPPVPPCPPPPNGPLPRRRHRPGLLPPSSPLPRPVRGRRGSAALEGPQGKGGGRERRRGGCRPGQCCRRQRQH